MPDVLIPWRGGCPHRERAHGWVVDQWQSAGFRTIVGVHNTGPWCKALAVRNALARSTSDVIVVADADVWPDQPITEALDRLDTHRWAIPHRLVHRLSESSSIDYMNGAPLTGCKYADQQGQDSRPHDGTAGGGIVILQRADYELAPLDPRFRGWGQEDISWAFALKSTLGRPWRGAADLVHLWHPPQERQNRQVGNGDSFRLHDRYRRAANNPDRMTALIEEARCPSPPRS